jgi:hypothetical protein
MLSLLVTFARTLLAVVFISIITAGTIQAQNSAPTIYSVEPSFVTVGSEGFNIVVTGAGFTENSVIVFNGTAKTTVYLSETNLLAALSESDVSQVGTFGVSVLNPDNQETEQLSFIVGYPTPTINGISPSRVSKGSSEFILTVSGSDFSTTSVVLLNGLARTTYYENSSTLKAIIESSDVVEVAFLNISVYTPDPGGGTTETVGLYVENPQPILNFITPSEVKVGTDGLTITVFGNNFQSNSVVTVDGSMRTTYFINSTELQAYLEPNDLSQFAEKGIRVFTPPPGGGFSEQVILSVTDLKPQLLSLTPQTKPVGSGGFVMAIIGEKFSPDAKVYFNTVELQPVYVNPEKLEVNIPESMLRSPANYSVFVVNVSANTRSDENVMFKVFSRKNIRGDEKNVQPKDPISSTPPAQYLTLGNYPNPFNPTTTISFALPADATVSLKVYNMIGQEIASLANNEPMSTGYYQKTFDASNLASGQYIYRLVASSAEAGEFKSMGRMLLMK